MLRDFAENGPTEEEFAIAKKQAGEALDQAVERPGFWTANLSDLRYRGRSFDELHGLDGLYDGFTVEDACSVARKYFVDDRELRVVAVPKGDS